MTVADGLTVLVVEDHDFERRTVARMLRSLGAREVREAADGGQALTLIRDAAPAPVDLVICDLDMPEMDGMELLRHLGQAADSAPVIITSGKERALLNSVHKMAREYGVPLLGIIEKPVTLDRLRELIARRHAPGPNAFASAAKPSFTVGEILHGLQDQQIVPFFQPKAELKTRKIVGAEALARWRHPEHGIVGPHAFIAPLEQSKSIDELTFLMLLKAAAACHGWHKRGLNLTVSVNLSLISLTDTTLAGRITQIVKSTGLDPQHVILEITETAAMTEVAPALENLARLRMRGFGLSVDDYGTGFSSLRQLTRVPFTELKVDQNFVGGCSADSALRAIVESSVEMARRLAIKSVAEGVETEAEWEVLKAVGCDMAQGYLIGKPMEEDSFLQFCAAAGARAE